MDVIEIPLKDCDEVIELSRDQLPSAQEVLLILQQERCPLHLWHDLAMEYYKVGNNEDFVAILKSADTLASLDYENSDRDQLIALDSLAAYYLMLGNKERDKELKKKYFAEATVLFARADQISMYDLDHLMNRAYFYMLEGDKIDQADAQFNFILTQVPTSVLALLGRASISFHRRDYKTAMSYYRRALKLNPNCTPDIRVGIGHCAVKLNKLDKASIAFERTLEIDPHCISALIGLAVLEINSQRPEQIKTGVHRLSQAYAVDSMNPIVLNHLAEHFFFKKDFDKVKTLALHSFHNTEDEYIRSESCYQLARAYHSEREYEQAFQYYYQATQFAGSTFVLPQYGLGQMYLQRGDKANASHCFEKVLKAEPGNMETFKILGCLYAESKIEDQKKHASAYLTKVVEHDPTDAESWIELAQLLEGPEPQDALKAYNTGVEILKNNARIDVPAQIWNNMGSLNMRMGNHELAGDCLRSAYATAKTEEHTNPQAPLLLVTIQYNLGRLHEKQNNPSLAERLYKRIIRNNPGYIDGVLRLGCMARDRGQIYEASDWFKEALQINPENPEAWSLIGNLHLAKQEWGPGQKKFERILKDSKQNDTYSMIALANVWLQTLYQPNREREKDKRHQDRAIGIYKAVLNFDPRNIWAANGIGCVLAHKGYLNEARDLFAQVREVTADFKDVWLNIAHVYVESHQYHSAVKMYESCYEKFCQIPDPEVLVYWARALFRGGQMKESLEKLLLARRICPDDTMICFNVALVQQRIAMSILQDERSQLSSVLDAVDKLQLAGKTFAWLAATLQSRLAGERPPGYKDPIVMLATQENQQCVDLLSQANYHVQRAKLDDERDKELRRIQEDKRRMMQEQHEKEIEARQREIDARKDEQRTKRNEFMTKTKKVLVPDAFEVAAGSSNRKQRTRDVYDDEDGSEGEEDREGLDGETFQKRKRKRKPKHSSKVQSKKEPREKRQSKKFGGKSKKHASDKNPEIYSSDGGEDTAITKQAAKAKTVETRYKSKAYISSSDESCPGSGAEDDDEQPVASRPDDMSLQPTDFTAASRALVEGSDSDLSDDDDLQESVVAEELQEFIPMETYANDNDSDDDGSEADQTPPCKQFKQHVSSSDEEEE